MSLICQIKSTVTFEQILIILYINASFLLLILKKNYSNFKCQVLMSYKCKIISSGVKNINYIQCMSFDTG